MPSAYSISHSGSAADGWKKGMKRCRMGLLNVHDILHGTPQLSACSGFTGPNRCYWPPLEGEHQLLSWVRRLSSVPRKIRGDYMIQVFPTDMQEIPHTWNRGDSGKICIWSRPYIRAHPLRSHRNRKHLKPVFDLAPQYSPPLSSTEPLHTLIRLRVNVYKKSGLEFVTTGLPIPHRQKWDNYCTFGHRTRDTTLTSLHYPEKEPRMGSSVEGFSGEHILN